MKKHLFILILLGLAIVTKAQDQLFKKDNSKLLVKITEISPDEIKYKLFNNLSGPTYVVNKGEVSLVVYENGQHEVINSSPTTYTSQPVALTQRLPYAMSKADSLKYYKYSNSISMNFFNFFNNEVGFIYQKDFFKNNFNIIIPFAVGIQAPSVTQSVYFSNNFGSINLDRKLFEAGFGINYYPTLKFPINYYIGPAFRYMQYGCQQNYTYYNQASSISNTITRNGTLSRYCVSITNGFIVRTKSRISINMFASIGFKNDVTNTQIIDPVTNIEVKPLTNAFNLYFWSGFAVGFSF